MNYKITEEQISSIVETIKLAGLRLEVLEMYKEKTENTKIVLSFLKDAISELKYIQDNSMCNCRVPKE